MTNEKIEFYHSLSTADAHQLPKEEILEALKVDELYYGKFGQNWYSNSFLTKMLEDPLLTEEDKVWGDGSALVIGKFCHQYILEPEKFPNFPRSQATNRNSTQYKEDRGKDRWLMLQKDVDKWTAFCEQAYGHDMIKEIFFEHDTETEVPLIGTLNGIHIKGKADAIDHTDKLIIDVKTTKDADAFNRPSPWSPEALHKARGSNYDAQAWLYSYLYPGYGFRFIVVDKEDANNTQIYDTTLSFMHSGRDKIFRSIDVLNNYHLGRKNVPCKLLH